MLPMERNQTQQFEPLEFFCLFIGFLRAKCSQNTRGDSCTNEALTHTQAENPEIVDLLAVGLHLFDIFPADIKAKEPSLSV